MERLLLLWDEFDDIASACRHLALITAAEVVSHAGLIGAAATFLGAGLLGWTWHLHAALPPGIRYASTL